MNSELLYTSAPQGLKQGSRGFCTVQSTTGMPINLAMKLESLSGYRHLYPPGDSRAALNPVAWSHLRFSLGGRTVSVLSRIADYGLDYSQRTNKLAHHLVLDAPLPPAGPVTLIQQPGVLKTSWDGKCTTLPPPMVPGVSAPGPGVCRTWQRLTGDAGWAGMVAQHWMQPRAKPLHLIFAESQSGQLMQLLAESMALLPPSMFWEATFSTYVTSLPPDIDCKVRCLVAGSEEARAIAARHTVIDLTKPNAAAPSEPAVEAARAGRSIQTAAAPVIAKAPEPMLEQKQEDNFFVLPDQDDAELTLQPDRPPPVVAPKLPPSRTASLPPVASQEPHKEPRRSPIEDRARIATIVAACSVLLVLALGGLAAWRYQQALQVTQADIATGQQVNEWGLPESSEQKSEISNLGGMPMKGELPDESETALLSNAGSTEDVMKNGRGISSEKGSEKPASEKEEDQGNEPIKPLSLPTPPESTVTCEVFAIPDGPLLNVILPGTNIRFESQKPYEIKNVILRYVSDPGKNITLSENKMNQVIGKWDIIIGNENALDPKQQIVAEINFLNCLEPLVTVVGESADVFIAKVCPIDAVNGPRSSVLQETRLQLLPPSNFSNSSVKLEWLCNKKALDDVGSLRTLRGVEGLEFVKLIEGERILSAQAERVRHVKSIRKKPEIFFGRTLDFISMIEKSDLDLIKKFIDSDDKIEPYYKKIKENEKRERDVEMLRSESEKHKTEIKELEDKIKSENKELADLAYLIPFDLKNDPMQLGIDDFWGKWNLGQKKLPSPSIIYSKWLADWRSIKVSIEDQALWQCDLFQIDCRDLDVTSPPIKMLVRFTLDNVEKPAARSSAPPKSGGPKENKIKTD